MKFLDLSNHNNVVNYDGIKNGFLGAICKASEGTTFTDLTFTSKVNNLKSKGLKVGAYHFFKFDSSPEQQALFFWEKIKNIQLDFIPVLDVEDRTTLHVDSYVSRFVEQFKKLSGMIPVIYTGWYYARDNFTASEKLKYKWWIASYGISNLPPIQNCDILAWQYTSSEQVSGIQGNVDCNVLLSDKIFRGNYTAIPTQPTIPTYNINDDGIVKQYTETGKATVIVDKLNVRSNPSTSSGSVLTSYVRGETFNYDYVIVTNSYVWCRYRSFNGNIRYVAVKNVKTGERYANCV